MVVVGKKGEKRGILALDVKVLPGKKTVFVCHQFDVNKVEVEKMEVDKVELLVCQGSQCLICRRFQSVWDYISTWL